MFLSGVILSASFATVFVHKLLSLKKKRALHSVEELKGALLVYALALVRRHDFSATSTRYCEYDGTMLPPLSGSSAEEACFKYLSSPGKSSAFTKYIEQNLATDIDVHDLFSDLLERSLIMPQVQLSKKRKRAKQA